MSADEMRAHCQGLCNFNLRVELRLKNTAEVLHGRINSVEAERFSFRGEDNVVQEVRFAWVARVKNA